MTPILEPKLCEGREKKADRSCSRSEANAAIDLAKRDRDRPIISIINDRAVARHVQTTK